MFYRFLSTTWKALFFTCLVLYASISPIDEVDSSGILNFPYADKIAHFFMYLVLTLSWLGGMHKYYYRSRKKVNRYLVGILVFIFGVFMEVLQFCLTTGRSAEFADIMANTLGILFAIVLLKWLINQQHIYKLL